MQKIVDPVLLGALNLLLYTRWWRQVYQFRRAVGYFPDIALPLRYNERILWRKIFDHNPLFTVFCDKLATKDFIASRDPSIPVPRTLWSTTRLDLTPDHQIGSDRVVKANHGCDFNDMPSDAPGEQERIEKLARQWLAVDYSQRDFQPAYGGVRRQLFAEEKLPVDHPLGLIDLNVWCCDGKAVLLSAIIHNKTAAMRVAYFDIEGERVTSKRQENRRAGPSATEVPDTFALPECWPMAVRHAQVLSRGVDFARFDFMSDWKQVWAGEITVYPSAGLNRASRPGQAGSDVRIAQTWDLRGTWFLTHPQRGWRGFYARWLARLLDQRATARQRAEQSDAAAAPRSA